MATAIMKLDLLNLSAVRTFIAEIQTIADEIPKDEYSLDQTEQWDGAYVSVGDCLRDALKTLMESAS